MDKYKLKGDEIEDIEDIIVSWEKSLNIKFGDCELENVHDFEDLTKRIIAKINLPNSDTCTSAITFYKLRRTFSEIGLSSDITPSTNLKAILPSKGRRKFASLIHKELGYDSTLLHPSAGIILILAIVLVAAFVTLFFHWELGLLGLLTTFMLFDLVDKFSKRINFKDMREFTKHVTNTNYLNMRGGKTVNYKELEKLIKQSFSDLLGVDSKDLKLYSF